jgi:peptidoglycan/LPS O-acetylase OafA/YrhL
LSPTSIFGAKVRIHGVAIFKPLIHLWSLGIEEQFYIVWAILAWDFWKARGGFFALTLVIAVASFAANIYLIDVDPTGVFYSPLTRAWELMVGSAMAYASLNFHGTMPRLSIWLRPLLSVGAMLLPGVALTRTRRIHFPRLLGARSGGRGDTPDRRRSRRSGQPRAAGQPTLGARR